MSIKLDWLGCATFRLLIDDLTIFLDTYIDKVSAAPNVGISTAEIKNADFIFIGHSHFDHIGGADVIAKNTGADVIGSNESVRILIEAGVPEEQLRRAQGGERYRLSDSVTVRVFPSLHSCIWIPNTFRPKADESQTGHLNLTEDERWGPRKPDPLPSGTDPNLIKEIEDHREETLGSSDIGGALCFLFETPQGSIFFQDTSGCWTGVVSDLRADAAILAMAGRPNIDGEPIQGSLTDYIGLMASMLKPKEIILGHHDDWMPPKTKDDSNPKSLQPVIDRINLVRPGTLFHQPKYLDATELLK